MDKAWDRDKDNDHGGFWWFRMSANNGVLAWRDKEKGKDIALEITVRGMSCDG